MRENNRLSARLSASEASQIETVSEDRGIEVVDAERLVVREGLDSMGYLERPSEASELLLWYLHRIGLLLGLVGLIMVGYGIFGPRTWSIIGFGLLLGGFLFVALEEGIRAVEARTAPEPAPEPTEHA